uniref:TPX2_importin domain-containing protein n=1 Tax=Steinernema glaseri TaxID=37863 RepID=A0A1I7ZDV7_9BILA
MSAATTVKAAPAHRGFSTKARGRLLEPKDVVEQRQKDKEQLKQMEALPPKKPVRRLKSESPAKRRTLVHQSSQAAPHRGFNSKAREMLLDPSKKHCDCTRHTHDARCSNANHKKSLIGAKPPTAKGRAEELPRTPATFANMKAHRLLCDSGKAYSAMELYSPKA